MNNINPLFYGRRVILLGLIIGIGMPIMLKWITGRVFLIFPFLGGLILVGIVILLFIKMGQDLKHSKAINSHRYAKIHLSYDNYECANCGNKSITKDEKFCHCCSIEFRETIDIANIKRAKRF